MSNEILENFARAIKKLYEVLAVPKDEISRDSAIKRFELCFDLAWKSIKNQAGYQGVECYSPRECFKTAYQLKLIDYQDDWLKMIDDRNLTIHLYSQAQANEVYERLPKYVELFNQLLSNIRRMV